MARDREQLSAPLRRPYSVYLRQLRTLLLRASPRAFWGLAVTRVVVALATPAIAYTGMRMMDAIVGGSRAGAIRWIAIECGLMALVAVLTSLQHDAERFLKGPLALEMTTGLADRVSQLPPSQLETPVEQERVARAREAAESRAGDLASNALTVVQGLLSLALLAVILATFSVWALLLLVAAAPGVVVELWSARALYRIRVRLSPDRHRFDQIEQNLLSQSHAPENSFLGVAPHLTGRLRELGSRACEEERRVWLRAGPATGLTQLLPALGFYGFYVYLAMQAASGHLTLGAVTLCLISFHSAQRFSQEALAASRSASEDWLYLQDYCDFIDEPRPSRPGRQPDSTLGPSAADGLSLLNVGFRYPNSEAWALRHIDLHVRPGEFLGIMGGNGSGKTTLMKLMAGLYRPTEGRILLDGRELDDWEPAALRRRFAMIFQRPARYQMTLRENVAARLRGPVDEQRLQATFAASGLDEVVPGLPRGAGTELGRAFGEGVELSGGQWQRVALARAFMREHADILLLDEPTASLDSAAERRILEHICTLRPDKSVVLIAHSLSALDPADRILVLERGRMVRLDDHLARGAAAVETPQ